MKLIEYLQGNINILIDDSLINSVLIDRGVVGTIMVEDVDVKTRELLYADILLKIITTSDGTSNYSYGDGFVKESFGASTLNRKTIINIIRGIYTKYGDPKITNLDMIDDSITMRFVEEENII